MTWPADFPTSWLPEAEGLTDWLSNRLIDWPAHWLTDWRTDWLTDGLADWLVDYLADWLTNWLIDQLTDWPTDWLETWWESAWIAGPEVNWSIVPVKCWPATCPLLMIFSTHWAPWCNLAYGSCRQALSDPTVLRAAGAGNVSPGGWQAMNSNRSEQESWEGGTKASLS